ncbi:hypothetical protein DRJ25_04455 [Candidatus Woesearchaeota archaeon]|nr:MAG: hypothetical protein DRJ25_04455 [Candidatus Woesearchaeota archaeon]
MTLWHPPEYPHNLLRGLLGDSPYYHISQNIYEALRSHGGYVPSASNPFATVDWVDNQILSQRQKTAWGRVGSTPPGTSICRYVNIQTGVADGGNYVGDVGFQNTPSIIYAVGDIFCTDTAHHSFTMPQGGASSSGFYVCTGTNRISIGWVHWLCVGD